MGVCEGAEPVDRVVQHHRVWIEQQDPAAPGGFASEVVAAPEAEVFGRRDSFAGKRSRTASADPSEEALSTTITSKLAVCACSNTEAIVASVISRVL